MEEAKAVRMTPYPWQDAVWQRLQLAQQQHRLAHAYLLCGARGIGKYDFARAWAAALLCLHPDQAGQACQSCSSCHLLKANTHPDLWLVEPAEGKQQIAIDQIRQLQEDLSLSSQFGRYRIAILSPADALNPSAANCLLKTLEEPASNTIILLVTSNPSRLPATIRSRCQRITFTAPDAQAARQWLSEQVGQNAEAELALQMTHYAPLASRQLLESGFMTLEPQLRAGLLEVVQGRRDPLQEVDLWLGCEPLLLLNWLQTLLLDLIRYRLAPGASGADDGLADFERALQATTLKDIFVHVDYLHTVRAQWQTAVNWRAVLESLLIAWHHRLQA